MSFNITTTTERVRKALDDHKDLVIEDLPNGQLIAEIPKSKAFRVDCAHVYVDIANVDSLLLSDDGETWRVHQRLLRYLHLWERAAHLVFERCEAVKVDLQNHRLHFIVLAPRGDAAAQIARAVAMGHLLQQLLTNADELHSELPDAVVCVGVEWGRSLVVRNGTHGDREPLFLGDPANHAAKLAGVGRREVFLGDAARAKIGWATADPATALTSKELTTLSTQAGLPLNLDTLVSAWKDALSKTPLATFVNFPPTPPLAGLAFDELSPANTARIESAAIFADVDGYTRFISRSLANSDEVGAVRALHVIRKELRDVLRDHGGRKVRYIGDCIVGVLADGDKQKTDAEMTVDRATLCAGALRSAFEIIQTVLPEAGIDISGLGLAIGYDFGPNVITRLGVRANRDRCFAGRSVINAQRAQEESTGAQTAIGDGAWAVAGNGVRDLFRYGRRIAGATYNVVSASITVDAPEKAASLGIRAAASAVIPVRAFAGTNR